MGTTLSQQCWGVKETVSVTLFFVRKSAFIIVVTVCDVTCMCWCLLAGGRLSQYRGRETKSWAW